MDSLSIFGEPSEPTKRLPPREVHITTSNRCYDPALFTYGHELETGDTPRYLHPPVEWGAWEYSETCSINRNPPYELQPSDPQGISPPMGGEINTVPTLGWESQVDRVMNIIEFFREAGFPPTISCVNDTHVHVRVPGLRNDIEGLKNLTRYIKENQAEVISRVHQFEHDPTMKGCSSAISYLKYGGGTPMPEWMCDNILQKATCFEDFIGLQCRGKAGDLSVRPNMPLRYAINTYCLKHIDTVEFRIFRATLDRKQLESCYRFVELFMDAALNGGPPVKEILDAGDWDFPKMVWERELYKAWETNKYPKSRGKKVRKLVEL
jgi:hypothetical protein